jgi:hypothetical protein
MACDHAPGRVTLRSGSDGVWVAWAMALCAGIQGSIETGLSAQNPYEAAAELLMLLSSGYLLGRSLVAWLRARALPPLAPHAAASISAAASKASSARVE